MLRLLPFWFLYLHWPSSILIPAPETFRICVIIEVKYWTDAFENFSVDHDTLTRQKFKAHTTILSLYAQNHSCSFVLKFGS